jgi:hypothetical protein
VPLTVDDEAIDCRLIDANGRRPGRRGIRRSKHAAWERRPGTGAGQETTRHEKRRACTPTAAVGFWRQTARISSHTGSWTRHRTARARPAISNRGPGRVGPWGGFPAGPALRRALGVGVEAWRQAARALARFGRQRNRHHSRQAAATAPCCCCQIILLPCWSPHCSCLVLCWRLDHGPRGVLEWQVALRLVLSSGDETRRDQTRPQTAPAVLDCWTPGRAGPKQRDGGRRNTHPARSRTHAADSTRLTRRAHTMGRVCQRQRRAAVCRHALPPTGKRRWHPHLPFNSRVTINKPKK